MLNEPTVQRQSKEQSLELTWGPQILVWPLWMVNKQRLDASSISLIKLYISYMFIHKLSETFIKFLAINFKWWADILRTQYSYGK